MTNIKRRYILDFKYVSYTILGLQMFQTPHEYMFLSKVFS